VMASHSGSNVSCTGEGEVGVGVEKSITCLKEGGWRGRGRWEGRYLEEIAFQETFIQR